MRRELERQPIYQQLNKILRDLIHEGHYKIGDQFLTERMICERFDVSRTTANKALSTLVSEGLLEFKKGVGTYVRGMVLDYDLRGLISFTEKMKKAGKRPENKVTSFSKLRAGDAGKIIMHELSLEPKDELYYFERIRLADGIPFIIERRYVKAQYCPGLDEKLLEHSLYVILEDKYNLKLTMEEETIKAISIKGRDAKLLNVPSGMAGFIMFVTGYHGSKIPLWSGQILYRGDCYEMHNVYQADSIPYPIMEKWTYGKS
jgi:GntR family transcriptional regulator